MLLAAWQDFAAIAVVLVVAYLVIMWAAALVWTYRDIRSRTRDQVMQVLSVLLVLAFNLPGLILYLIVRPSETLAENYDRRLEAEAILRELGEQPACPACRRRISEEYVACPYCRTTLKVPCSSCAKPLASEWVTCPYCSADRMPAIAPSRTPALARPADDVAAASSSPPRRPARRPSTATYTPQAKPQAEQPQLDVSSPPSVDLPGAG